MPDTLVDGNFRRATAVGAPRFEYPFRKNGDRVTALFEEDYWQTAATFTPQEMQIEHETRRGFYLIHETPPVEFIAGLLKFTRTYARVPAQQTEYSSIVITMPEPTGVVGAEAPIVAPNSGNAYLTTNERIYVSPNFAFYKAAYYAPVKLMTANIASNVITLPNHGFTNGKALIWIASYPTANLADTTGVWVSIFHDTTQWSVINSNAFQIPGAGSGGGQNLGFTQLNRGTFGSGARFMRCKRVTNFYLPGVTPGIATPDDIPLPADESNSGAFIDRLLAGTGSVNVQVGELGRWRESPIYQITKTTIEVTDLV